MKSGDAIRREPIVSLIALICALTAIVAGARLSDGVGLHPNADLYTHLSVARHLLHGDGFRNDMAYPISMAFPFARELPQPLIQRTPGYPLLLTPVVALSGDDPARAVDLAIDLQLLLVGLLVFIGARHLLRERRSSILPAWMLTLAAGVLLPVAIGRAEIEIIAAVILLLLWLRLRDALARSGTASRDTDRGAAVLTGLLAGVFCLLRGELFWLPLFWLLLAARGRRRPRLSLTLGVGLLLLLPWLLRNLLLTGNPVFSIQAHAEHLKGVADWPGYGIYQSLNPESILESLLKRPLTVLHKAGSGIKYFILHPARWLAWPLWILGVTAGLNAWRSGRPRIPLILTLSVGLMMLTYAPFSAEDRHLLIIYPILTLEIWREVAEALRRLPRRYRLIPPTLLAGAILAFAPARIEGYRLLDPESEVIHGNLEQMLAVLASQPPGPVFTDSAELLWYGRRSGIWLTRESGIAPELRRLVPALGEAPILFCSDQGDESVDDREDDPAQQAERQDHDDQHQR